jgi:hypothetical protein
MKMKKKTIFLILIVMIIFIVNISSGFADRFNCIVSVEKSKLDDPVCKDYVDKINVCPIEGDFGIYDPQGYAICSGFCLKQSGIPDQCAEITLKRLSGSAKTLDSGEEHHKEKGKQTKNDCSVYEKFYKGKCVLRTEKECYDFEFWNGTKCEMRCDLDMTWNGAICVDPDDPYGLLNMTLNSEKIVDNGKIKMGIIHHKNGAYVFSIDGINYYTTPETAINPGLFTKVKNSVFSLLSWVSNSFFGGKSLDPDQKLMEKIADSLLKEIKKKPMTFEKANKLIGKSSIKILLEKGIKIFVGPLAKGVSIPGKSIEMLAERGNTIEFESDIVEYIKLRKIMGKEDIKKSADALQDISTINLFSSEAEMYDSFEVAYQRFLLAKSLN